jgi:hypothetical protein
VRYGRRNFTTAALREISKNGRHDSPANIGESVAVEKEERSPAVASAQKLNRVGQGECLRLLIRPIFCARFLSLAIKAVLRASSCARCSVEADDKLPTPVLEKLGSGL